MTTWTEERWLLAKRLFLQGYSCGYIAKELGGGVTRSAVIGRLHRMGLSKHSRPNYHPPKIRRERRRGPGPTLKLRPTQVRVPHPEVLRYRPVRPAPNGGVSFFDVKEDQCRYPLTDDSLCDLKTFRFCGCQIEPGVMGFKFCAEHAERCLRSGRGNSDAVQRQDGLRLRSRFVLRIGKRVGT